MSFEQWIDVASSIGTVVAAAMAAISIGVIRRQNRNQYLPKITVSDMSCRVILNGLQYNWKLKDASRDGDKRPYLTLLNVGNGVATHVTVEWKYNLDRMTDSCNKMLLSSGSKLSLREKGGWLNVMQEGETQGSIRVSRLFHDKLDYIAPVTVQGDGRNIPVDGAIQALSTTLTALMGESGEKMNFSRVNQTFTLSVSYLDSLGNKYSQDLHMKLFLSGWIRAFEGNPAEAIFNIHLDM